MRDKRSSQSAMGVALMRAIEADKPAAERICYDPLARAFISGATHFFLKPIINSGWHQRAAKGAVEFIILRERDLHDQSLETLKQRYLTGPNSDRPVPTGIAIASAQTQP